MSRSVEERLPILGRVAATPRPVAQFSQATWMSPTGARTLMSVSPAFATRVGAVQ